MNAGLLIDNVQLLTPEGKCWGHIVVDDRHIVAVGPGPVPEGIEAVEHVDGEGGLLMAGCIDEHVHFREPGLTRKGDIESESRAAVAGGVTSFIDMPNTVPPTVSVDALEQKLSIAGEVSAANYGFYLGATAHNLEEIKRVDPTRYAGVKIFAGSTTGNMLLDDAGTVRRFFKEVDKLFAVHAESNKVIAENVARYKALYGEELPVTLHPDIRSRQACYQCASQLVEMARETGARMHLLHVSTVDELSLYSPDFPNVTFETCPQYLTFERADYERLGARIKCNPAIKDDTDRQGLLQAVADGRIATVGTDHAPHLLEEKQGGALTAVSGLPSIQYSLPLMLTLADDGAFTHARVADVMCAAPARLFGIKDRGVLAEGSYADLVLLRRGDYITSDDDVVSRCGWTPYDSMHLNWQVAATWVNGHQVYQHGSPMPKGVYGEALKFS